MTTSYVPIDRYWPEHDDLSFLQHDEGPRLRVLTPDNRQVVLFVEPVGRNFAHIGVVKSRNGQVIDTTGLAPDRRNAWRSVLAMVARGNVGR